jgi:DNA end-binding protein Ku
LFFADEIRDRSVVDAPARLRGNSKELKIAEQLIDNLTVAWDPKRYKDTYRNEVLRLIRRKAKGETIAVEEPEEERAGVTDLMEALRASLESGKRSAGAGGKRRRRAS